MTIEQAAFLALASCLAGMMNAIAGGGTVLTFPALLLSGTSSIVANATSTFALCVGTVGSIFGYRKQLAGMHRLFVRLAWVSVAGGLLGSFLLTITTERTFDHLVPFLMFFATALFILQGLVTKRVASVAGDHHSAWWLAPVQFGISLYGGYFGAGIGILMLAAFGLLGLGNIHESNALKTVLSSLINAVASVYFAMSGIIDWPKALLMTVCAITGYFLGAHYSQKLSQTRVRMLVILIGIATSVITFWREFA